MSSTDNTSQTISQASTSPSSSASCSHCSTLFIHSKGCRYCFPVKNHAKTLSENDEKTPPIDEKTPPIDEKTPTIDDKTPPTTKKKRPPSTGTNQVRPRCVVPCCTNYSGSKKNFFFPVIENEQKEVWEKAVGVKAMRSKFAICEEHFDLEADLENYVKFKYYPTKWNRLKKTALPTKFSCKMGEVSCPEHDHIFMDLNIRTGATQRRSSDVQLVENDLRQVQRVKSIASGAISTTNFGYPPELKKYGVAQVEVHQDEPEEVSVRDNFDFLNGDISNLIAQVQPSIRLSDTSVVNVHSPGSSNSNECQPTSSYVLPEGSDITGGSKTENQDATDGMELENLTEKGLETGNAKVEQILCGGSSDERCEAKRQHPERQDSSVEEVTKLATVHGDSVSELSTIIIENELQQPPTRAGAASEQPNSTSGSCNGDIRSEHNNPLISESSKDTDENDTINTEVETTLSDSQTSSAAAPSGATALDSSVVIHEIDMNADTEDSKILDCAQSHSEEIESIEIPELVVIEDDAPEKNVPISEEVLPKQNTELDVVDLTSEMVIDSASVCSRLEVRLAEGSSNETPKPAAVNGTTPTSDDSQTVKTEIDLGSVCSQEEVNFTDEPSHKTPEIAVVCDHSSTVNTEIDNASVCSREGVDSSPDKTSKLAVSGDDIPTSVTVDPLSGCSPVKVNSRFPFRKSVRVAKKNCSCVMCGGVSDGVEEDSDVVDSLATSAAASPSQKVSPVRKKTPRHSGTSNSRIETKSKNASGTNESLVAQSPSWHIKRTFKKIEEQSDGSENLTEDDPDLIDSDIDTDSEWSPTEDEETFVQTRTTRNSVKSKDIVPTRRTRRREKPEKASADNSLRRDKNVETDDEEECESLQANKSSLEVNLSETVASYSLDNSDTTYSYKQLYEGEQSSGSNAPESKRSDKVLVIRDNENDEFNEIAPLPQPIVDLLENMKTYFDHFFEKLEKMKENISKPDGADEPALKETSAKQIIETLEEDIKMFPALLNLEMVQFSQKCKQYYKKQLEDLGQRFKKIRWCAVCPQIALFHCCFKAAYCSSKCQGSHWYDHKKECAQESGSLLDPHLRLNKSLALRVKNLNKSRCTIADLEKSDPEEHPSKNNSTHLPDKKNEKDGNPRKDGASAQWKSGKRKRSDVSPQKSSEYLAIKRRCSSSTPKTIGTKDPLEGTHSQSDVVLKPDPPESNISAKHTTPVIQPSGKREDSKIGASTVLSTSGKQVRISESFSTSCQFPKYSQGAKVALAPQLRPTAQVKALVLTKRTTSLAAPAASKARVPSGSLLLPKSMMNVGGVIRTPGNTNQVVVKVRTVLLPNGEKRFIPLETNDDNNFFLTNTNPRKVKPAKSGSSSIFISRPPKSTYTGQTRFIPVVQTSPSLSKPLYIQQNANGLMTTSPMPTVAPQMTPAMQLPKLTPIPKQGSSSIRTLNDDELDKILNTDHLQSAFDDSYYANTRIRS